MLFSVTANPGALGGSFVTQEKKTEQGDHSQQTHYA